MTSSPKRRAIMLGGTLLLASAGLTLLAPSATAAGTLTADKTLGATSIGCGGSTEVTVEIDAMTGIAGTPADIQLVLDRSSSMSGQPFADMKSAANAFVDIIDEATDGVLDGVIAHGSRVGVVAFDDNATVAHPLSSNATTLKAAINALTLGNLTNHQDAIDTAQAGLAGSNPASSKKMLIFTDGGTTAGGDSNAAAANARAAGTEIFAIGLGGVNVGQLNNWATDPDSEHVFLTPDSSRLEAIFTAIGAAIVVPAATGAEVVETVNSHFAISDVAVSKGSFSQTGNEITWDIGDLGTETVTMTYTVTHDVNAAGGTESVSSTAYSDDEGQSVSFPVPQVEVHGCAATLSLSPAMDDNTVGDAHTVTAEVLDDFGDPVEGVDVDFGVVGGPSSVDGDPSTPDPATGSGTTDAAGQTSFTWSNAEASLDTVTATAAPQPLVSSELAANAGKQWHPIVAVIDVKPGSDPSAYGGNSNGYIPVALLGSATFDTALVDDATVLFGDAPDTMGDASPRGSGRFEDVNSDGFVDKVYHFKFSATGLDPSDTEACLSGEIDGLDFLGCDAVKIT